ncbi:unnamed protein product [Closterium sp. NIES-53]
MHLIVRAARNSRINPTTTTPPAVAAALSTSGSTSLAIPAQIFRRCFALPDPTTPCSAVLHSSSARLASALPSSSSSSLSSAAGSSLGVAARDFLPSFQTLSASKSPLAATAAAAAAATAARCGSTAAGVGARAVGRLPLGVTTRAPAAVSLSAGAAAAATAAVSARAAPAVAARVTATAAAAAPFARSAAGLLHVARSVLSLMGAGLTALAATQLLPGATVHASERPSYSHGVLHVPPAAAHATSAGVAAARLESNNPAAISSSASSAAVSASWWWQKATADGQSQTASQLPSQVASHAHSPLAYRPSHAYSVRRSHSHTVTPSATHGASPPPQKAGLLSAGGHGSLFLDSGSSLTSWARASHSSRSSSCLPPLSAPTDLPLSASAAAAARRACSPPAAAHSALLSPPPPPAPFRPHSPRLVAQSAWEWQLCSATSELNPESGTNQGTQGREERGREGGRMETRVEGDQYDGWTIVGEARGMKSEWRGALERTEREVRGQKREEAGGGWELVAGGGTGRGVAREAERGMERGKDGGMAEGRAGEAGAAVRAQGERTACVAVTGASGQSRESIESRERGESRERWEQWECGECSERVQQQSMWHSGKRRSMDETHVLKSAGQQSHAWQPPTSHQSHTSGHSPGHPSGYPPHYHTSSSSLAPSAHIPFPPCSPGSSPSPSPSSTSSSLASSSAASASPCSPLRPMAPPRRTKRTDERSQCTTTRISHTMTCAQEITEENAQGTALTGDSMMGSQCNALLTQPRDILPRTPSVTCFSSRATPAVFSSYLPARPVEGSALGAPPLSPAPPASPFLDCAQPSSGAAHASAVRLGLWNEEQQQQQQQQQREENKQEEQHSHEYQQPRAHAHGPGQGLGHAYELLSSPAEAAAVAEALCHSQSRAREAEQAAAEAESRQQWVEHLFWHECTRSYSFQQWAHMLQLQVSEPPCVAAVLWA